MADDIFNASSDNASSDAVGGSSNAGAAPSGFDPMADLGSPSGTSADSVTETTSVSWTDKLGEAIGGVLMGLVLVLACGFALFWNEGRAVRTARSLSEGASAVVEAPTDQALPANEGKLVHVQGDLTTTAPLVDPPFGVEVKGARLVRGVEMYQWKEESHTETHKRVGGGEDRTTTYTYSRVWHDGRYDSSRFHLGAGHENPEPRYRDTEVVARDGRVGQFRPGPAVLEKLGATETVSFNQGFAEWLRARPGMGQVQLDEGNLYLGESPSNPRVGDLRVTYRLAPLGAVSMIGRQSGAELDDYQTVAGDRLLMARYGLVAASEMFAGAQAENRILTWILRAVGSILLWVGFFLILRPIAVAGDIVPFVGGVLAAGAGIASLVLTLVIAPLVIGVAWLLYRPVVGIALLAAGAAIAYGLHALSAGRRGSAPAVPPLPSAPVAPLPQAAAPIMAGPAKA